MARIVEERDAIERGAGDHRDEHLDHGGAREPARPGAAPGRTPELQNEYYLTDLVAELHDAGHVTSAMLVEDPDEAAGVNDRAQLAAAEAVLRQRINERLDAARA